MNRDGTGEDISERALLEAKNALNVLTNFYWLNVLGVICCYISLFVLDIWVCALH